MNNFLKNQIRRANCALATKVILFVIALVCPGKVWRMHVEHIQRQLDSEHNGNCASWSYLDLHPSRCRSAFPSAL